MEPQLDWQTLDSPIDPSYCKLAFSSKLTKHLLQHRKGGGQQQVEAKIPDSGLVEAYCEGGYIAVTNDDIARLSNELPTVSHIFKGRRVINHRFNPAKARMSSGVVWLPGELLKVFLPILASEANAPKPSITAAYTGIIAQVGRLVRFYLQEGQPGWFQLRPSSEVLLRARAPGARLSNAPSKLAPFASPEGGPIGLPPARVQRGPSQAARCARTGDQQDALSPTSTPPRSSLHPIPRSCHRIRPARCPNTLPAGGARKDGAGPGG